MYSHNLSVNELLERRRDTLKTVLSRTENREVAGSIPALATYDLATLTKEVLDPQIVLQGA